jgi:hypothetical protein
MLSCNRTRGHVLFRKVSNFPEAGYVAFPCNSNIEMSLLYNRAMTLTGISRGVLGDCSDARQEALRLEARRTLI